MRVFVTREQLGAIWHTRHTRSPGGTGALLGISRQRVMQLVDKPGRDGFLAWINRSSKTPHGREYVTLYIDLGPWGEDQALHMVDPRAWQTEDPKAILDAAMGEYARNWARRVAAGD
jgi:hypothetical protein